MQDEPKKLEPIDVTGRRIEVGDLVRVLAVPNLSGMHPAIRKESEPVFAHIVGTYKRVIDFDKYGHIELFFRIRTGPHRGLHSVWIEPHLLRVRRMRR